MTIFTIGHSTRSVEDFIGLLRANGIKLIVDVRTVPKSRHNPGYNRDILAEVLRKAHIRYDHMPGLGGLRHARKDSSNTGWRNASFRGFADYMQTDEFSKSLDGLVESARKTQTAIMCAEAVPWHCHRSLIGDALLVRGFRVLHIMGATTVREHSLTPWAKTEGERITYPEQSG